jgi:hypothetical protein
MYGGYANVINTELRLPSKNCCQALHGISGIIILCGGGGGVCGGGGGSGLHENGTHKLLGPNQNPSACTHSLAVNADTQVLFIQHAPLGGPAILDLLYNY